MRKSESNESRYVTSAHDSRELHMFVVCSVLVQGQGGRQAQGGARRPHTPSAVPTYLYLRTSGRVRQQTYHSSGTFTATGVVVGGRGFFAHRPTHPRPGSAISPVSAISVCNIPHFDFDLRVYEYTPVRGTGGGGARPRARVTGPGRGGHRPRRPRAGRGRPRARTLARPAPRGRSVPVRRWGWCI